MNAHELRNWLRQDDPQRLETLWRLADDARRQHVGDAVHLRALIEISNRCARLCGYCGLRADNRRVKRYRMLTDEIVACAEAAAALDYGTVVLQSGEDPAMTGEWVADLIRRIKAAAPLAVTLSLGQHPRDEYAAWRDAGADRYLMRFETSNADLYDRIHAGPPGGLERRLNALGTLRELGYELGTGFLIGLPGQTWEDLARDIERLVELDADMIGIGPFIPHGDTPLGRGELPPAPQGKQVPPTEAMTHRVLALVRLHCPDTNIPATTALATLDPAARQRALARGANVVMPNFTPRTYRECYEIYPAKVTLRDEAADFDTELRTALTQMGRTIGVGRGDSPHLAARK